MLPKIDELASSLKLDLQPHYEVIVELLAKKTNRAAYCRESSLEHKWDRQVFCVFCSLMPIHNKDHFDWWSAVLHSAAFHGKPLNSIPSFFGITTILRGSLNKKLGGFIKASDVMMKGRRTLLDAGCFGVCAIDNTQIMTPWKCQRSGTSSNMNMYTTTRLFFYVVNPETLELHLWPLHTVPITYMDQAIPPPMGMPMYHLSDPITVTNFEQQPLPSYASFVDYTGYCVKSYVRRFKLSQTTSSFRKLIPHCTWEGTERGESCGNESFESTSPN